MKKNIKHGKILTRGNIEYLKKIWRTAENTAKSQPTFDIAHSKALEMISNEENTDFLLAQQKGGLWETIRSVDT